MYCISRLLYVYSCSRWSATAAVWRCVTTRRQCSATAWPRRLRSASSSWTQVTSARLSRSPSVGWTGPSAGCSRRGRTSPSASLSRCHPTCSATFTRCSSCMVCRQTRALQQRAFSIIRSSQLSLASLQGRLAEVKAGMLLCYAFTRCSSCKVCRKRDRGALLQRAFSIIRSTQPCVPLGSLNRVPAPIPLFYSLSSFLLSSPSPIPSSLRFSFLEDTGNKAARQCSNVLVCSFTARINQSSLMTTSMRRLYFILRSVAWRRGVGAVRGLYSADVPSAAQHRVRQRLSADGFTQMRLIATRVAWTVCLCVLLRSVAWRSWVGEVHGRRCSSAAVPSAAQHRVRQRLSADSATRGDGPSAFTASQHRVAGLRRLLRRSDARAARPAVQPDRLTQLLALSARYVFFRAMLCMRASMSVSVFVCHKSVFY